LFEVRIDLALNLKKSEEKLKAPFETETLRMLARPQGEQQMLLKQLSPNLSNTKLKKEGSPENVRL